MRSLPRTRRGRMVFWLAYYLGIPALLIGTALALYYAYLWNLFPKI